MNYIFKSEIGTFSIEIDWAYDVFKLCLGGLWLCTYETAENAAEHVYLQKTGWLEWDRLENAEAPSDLGDWESV